MVRRHAGSAILGEGGGGFVKSLILRPHEVMELGRAGEVEIMRRIKWPVRSVCYAGTRKIYQTLSQVAIDLNYPEDRKHPHEAVDCPYGRHGEMRWVRETWQVCPAEQCIPGEYTQVSQWNKDWRVVYRATVPSETHPDHPEWLTQLWRSSAHMPRWASRYTVKVLAVGVAEVEEVGFWFLRLGKVAV